MYSSDHMNFCTVRSPKAHRAEWELRAAWSRSPELRSTPVREEAARFKDKESTEPWEGALSPYFLCQLLLIKPLTHTHPLQESLTLILCLLQKRDEYRLWVNNTKHRKKNKHLHAFSLLDCCKAREVKKNVKPHLQSKKCKLKCVTLLKSHPISKDEKER